MSHRALSIVLSLGIVVALLGGCTCGSVGTGAIAWVAVNGLPSVGPTNEPGLRVLFVDESKDGKLADVTADKAVREYLDSHCVKVAGQPEWRAFDPDRNTEHDGKIWQDLLKRERKSLPWLLVSNGRKGYEGPCPVKPAELLPILKKYGGP